MSEPAESDGRAVWVQTVQVAPSLERARAAFAAREMVGAMRPTPMRRRPTAGWSDGRRPRAARRRGLPHRRRLGLRAGLGGCLPLGHRRGRRRGRRGLRLLARPVSSVAGPGGVRPVAGGRARRFVDDGRVECAASGHLLIPELLGLLAVDPAAAHDLGGPCGRDRRAAADSDLQAFGILSRGQALIAIGRIIDGFRLFWTRSCSRSAATRWVPVRQESPTVR